MRWTHRFGGMSVALLPAMIAALVLSDAAMAPATAAAGWQVVDGDTIVLDGQKHRLFGIDAPEAGQKCKAANGGTWTCGKAAAARLTALLSQGRVSCDDRGRDRYDRILSVCTAKGRDVNAQLVREGLAWAFVKYSSDYVAEQAAAQAGHLGVWQARTETAQAFRLAEAPAEQAAPSGSCDIKGNISKKGERIYHTRSDRTYAATRITPSKGERWFCSVEEAVKAGWRAPRG